MSFPLSRASSVPERGPAARPASSRPHAVLFDLDGTLIDSIELILSSARHAFDRCGIAAPSDAEWLAGVGRPLATMFRHYAPNDVDRLVAAYREYQLANHDRLVSAYAGVPEVLAALRGRGHATALVTSKSDWLAVRGMEHVGIASYIDVVVGCDSCTRHKPDPEPVTIALERLGYAPGEAVFVGDSVHDMDAGRAAGVATIAALWGPFSRAELEGSLPSFYMDAVTELPGILATLVAG